MAVLSPYLTKKNVAVGLLVLAGGYAYFTGTITLDTFVVVIRDILLS